MEEEFPDTPLSRKMFPSWFAHLGFLVNMTLLAEDRYDYNYAKNLPLDDPGRLDALQRTQDLLQCIEQYQNAQEIRVADIQNKIMEVELLLKGHENDVLQFEKQRLTGFVNYEPPREWERDEDVEDELEDRSKEYDAARALHSDLLDRQLFEATISGRIHEAKKTFANRARLRQVERDQWLHETETAAKLRIFRPPLSESLYLTLDCMERRLNEHKSAVIRHQTLLLEDADQEAINVERNSIFVLNKEYKPLTSTFDPKFPKFPFKVPHKDEPEFCEYCEVPGHFTVHCKRLYPDEEDIESACGHCRKEGHHQNECWELHPELKAEYVMRLNKAKDKKCKECGAVGRARAHCYKLHGSYKTSLNATLHSDNVPRDPVMETALNHNPSKFPSPYNYYGPKEYIQLTEEELQASRDFAAPAPASESFPQKYCGFCNVYGHRDMDCQVPDVPVSQVKLLPLQRRDRKFAKAVR